MDRQLRRGDPPEVTCSRPTCESRTGKPKGHDSVMPLSSSGRIKRRRSPRHFQRYFAQVSFNVTVRLNTFLLPG
jgi:hypothetical protein